jgi:hypothetical protein
LSNKNLIRGDDQIDVENISDTFITNPFIISNDFKDEDLPYQLSESNLTINLSLDEISAIESFPVIIDPGVDEIGPALNTFVRSSNKSSFPRNNTPWALAVGAYTYDTTTPDGYFGRTETFFKFYVKPNTGIVEANLNVFQYNTYGSTVDAIVQPVTNFSTDQLSWNFKPAFNGGTSNITLHYINTDKFPEIRTSGNLAGIVPINADNSMTFGLRDGTSISRGTFFCSSRSRNIPHPCNAIGNEPYLYIKYNRSPEKPVNSRPANNSDILGNCDLSRTPAVGNCNLLNQIELRSENLRDPDNNYAGYFIQGQDRNLTTYNDYTIFNTGDTGARHGLSANSVFPNITNGRYMWRTISYDTYGLQSATSNQTSFTLDTQPPLQIAPLGVPAILYEAQIEINLSQTFADNLLDKVNITSLQTGNYLKVSGYSPNTHLQIIPHNSSDLGQRWIVEGTGVIRNIGGFCLTNTGLNTHPIVTNCIEGNNNQKWQITNLNQIKLTVADICLSTNSTNIAGLPAIYLAQCSSSNEQKFAIQKQPSSHYIESVASPNFVFDDNGERNVYLHPTHSGQNQHWTFTDKDEIVVANRWCVTTSPSALTHWGASNDLYLGDCNNTNNQKFVYDPNELTIKSKFAIGNSQLCIDNPGANFGYQIYMHPCHGGSNQKFRLKNVQKTLDPTKELNYFVQVVKDKDIVDEASLKLHLNNKQENYPAYIAAKDNHIQSIEFNGRLYQFITDFNHRIMGRSLSPLGQWSPWMHISGGLSYYPVEATISNNRLRILAVGTDNRVYLVSSSNGLSWENWSELGGG